MCLPPIRVMLRRTGHGHVIRRDDGWKADCGGFGLCPRCGEEQRIVTHQDDMRNPEYAREYINKVRAA